jgi:hypothetical protein
MNKSFKTILIKKSTLFVNYLKKPSQTRRWSRRKPNCYGCRQDKTKQKKTCENRGILKPSWAFVETNIEVGQFYTSFWNFGHIGQWKDLTDQKTKRPSDRVVKWLRLKHFIWSYSTGVTTSATYTTVLSFSFYFSSHYIVLQPTQPNVFIFNFKPTACPWQQLLYPVLTFRHSYVHFGGTGSLVFSVEQWFEGQIR